MRILILLCAVFQIQLGLSKDSLTINRKEVAFQDKDGLPITSLYLQRSVTVPEYGWSGASDSGVGGNWLAVPNLGSIGRKYVTGFIPTDVVQAFENTAGSFFVTDQQETYVLEPFHIKNSLKKGKDLYLLNYLSTSVHYYMINVRASQQVKFYSHVNGVKEDCKQSLSHYTGARINRNISNLYILAEEYYNRILPETVVCKTDLGLDEFEKRYLNSLLDNYQYRMNKEYLGRDSRIQRTENELLELAEAINSRQINPGKDIVYERNLGIRIIDHFFPQTINYLEKDKRNAGRVYNRLFEKYLPTATVGPNYRVQFTFK